MSEQSKHKSTEIKVSTQLESLERQEQANMTGSLLSGRKGTWKGFWQLLVDSKLPWLFIAITIIVGLAATRLGAFFPKYQQTYFDGNITKHTLTVGFSMVFLAFFVGRIADYLRGYSDNLISLRLRNRLWKHVTSLPLSVYQKLSAREIISRITVDAEALSVTLNLVLTTMISSTYGVILFMVELYNNNPKLAMAQFAVIPFFIIFKFFAGRINFNLSFRSAFKFASLTRYMASILVNVPLIKSFNREQYERERGKETIHQYNRLRFITEATEISFTLVDQIFQSVNDAICIVYGGYLITQGEIDTGQWISFYLFSAGIYANLLVITNLWPMIKSSQGSLQRIQDILQIQSEDWADQSQPIESVADTLQQGDICLHHVDYAYDDELVLKNINLCFKQGTKTALVGPSGSGKSTLMMLLERFYEPKSGLISYGEHAASEYGLAAWRKNFGMLQQEIKLFHGTIRENLVYGLNGEYSDSDLLKALDQVNLTNFIAKQPEGLNTLVNEGGASFSGGERQRIAVARLLLKNPEIILLDEATSNLDARSEKMVRESLEILGQGRTVIEITHNLSSTRHADQIVVLEDGEIAGSGTHEELINNCSLYRHLYKTEVDARAQEGDQ